MEHWQQPAAIIHFLAFQTSSTLLYPETSQSQWYFSCYSLARLMSPHLPLPRRKCWGGKQKNQKGILSNGVVGFFFFKCCHLNKSFMSALHLKQLHKLNFDPDIFRKPICNNQSVKLLGSFVIQEIYCCWTVVHVTFLTLSVIVHYS